ncbi:HD-GYP domain-containing protein [Fusibacter ferrireducens]|uniref:HD domain-containing protein n=1 Tax=Fusibacter ferrireducens TaxID=2785058 RepID=A0ABR9ZUN7_9FIRM|nr:HD family phosphohydrolase [Fusibacter ferrireducens]MBF4693600.1 HD domain-containing protein [Fusibacter ferrireducens]
MNLATDIKPKEIILKENYEKLLKVGKALTAEKDYNKLLELILNEMRKIAKADGGTLYIIDDGKLHHKIMQNHTLKIFLGGKGEPINFKPLELVETHIAPYTAIHKRPVNIPDVYHTELFDFKGPKEFDKAVGYITKSMLVVPLINRDDDVIGVVQLINAMDHGELIPFSQDVEEIVMTLSSQASIALENMQYVDEIRALFDSFVAVLVTAIDERTPYNANHSRNVAIFTERFARAINAQKEGPYGDFTFEEEHIRTLVMAAWLHDIGKVTVPESVMNKPTRLSTDIEFVENRLKLIKALVDQRYYKTLANCDLTDTEKHANEVLWISESQFIEAATATILKANEPNTFMDEKMQSKIVEIYEYKFEGIEESILNQKEFEFLMVQKGTLTDKEREVMENHVVTTEKMLSKIKFPKDLKDVPYWAVNHHEMLDGSGYPRGLKQDEISIEIRILTIIDIYDALTATDRPYKKGMPAEKAFFILGKMVEEGKLDGDLLSIFEHSEAWHFKN